MTFLDWIIIIFYAGGLIVLGWWLGLKQKTSEDYYLAGRKLPWLPIGFSTMATQLGAISLISGPAFVALREGGGMIWLGYELALPLATPLPAIAGLVSGVTANLFLWLFVPSVSWLWWNAIGFALATTVIFFGSLLFQSAFRSSFEIKISPEKRGWKISYGLLIVYVAGLILFLIIFPKLF